MGIAAIIKTLTYTGIALAFCVGAVQSARATGIVEDKDPLEDRGPGNLDSPTEPNPDAKAAPTGEAKPVEAPTTDADKKSGDAGAPPAAPAY